MKMFNLFPTFNHEGCVEKLIAIIPAHMLAAIIRKKVETVGTTGVSQRLLVAKDSQEYYNGMWNNSAEDQIARNRSGLENVEASKFEAGEGTVILNVSSKLIDRSVGSVIFRRPGHADIECPGCIYLPEEHELDEYHQYINVPDGQTHLFSFDNAIFTADESIRTGVNYVCHILIDATPEQERKAFNRNNLHRKKIDTSLMVDHNVNNKATSLDEEFAAMVLRGLATDIVDLGGDFGSCYSDIHGNINFGRKEGKYNLNKLIEALSKGPVSLYAAYGGNGIGQLEDHVVKQAVRDVARVLRIWNVTNSNVEHGGSDTIFGSRYTPPKAKKSSKKRKPIIEAAPIVQKTNATRVGGHAHRDIHYIFATAPAVLMYNSYNDNKVAAVRDAIEVLYRMRIKTKLEDKALSGGGGGDIFTKAFGDAKILLSKADGRVVIEEKLNRANNKKEKCAVCL